jgi:anaerobic selenocysteine-containing dehydrogenase
LPAGGCTPATADYTKWKGFIAEPRNSPEVAEPVTGVPAALVRQAARLADTAWRSGTDHDAAAEEGRPRVA